MALLEWGIFVKGKRYFRSWRGEAGTRFGDGNTCGIFEGGGWDEKEEGKTGALVGVGRGKARRRYVVGVSARSFVWRGKKPPPPGGGMAEGME